MIDVFLGYADEDRGRGDALRRVFADAGWTVWTLLDPRLWDDTVEASTTASAVVVLWSRASVKSLLVVGVANAGMYRGVLLPVLLEQATVPEGFGHLQTFDLASWAGAADEPQVSVLLDAIRALVDTARTARQSSLTSADAPASADVASEPTAGEADDPPDGRRREEAVADATTEVPGDLARKKSTRSTAPGCIAPAIFICYRRDDTQGEAGRLHDRLVDAYGAASVFMDVDSVPLGIDFVEHVTQQIAGCKAVVVMIGREWLTVRDKAGQRRLDDPEDLVRVEVAAALNLKVPVIPVLVQNAVMPNRDDLPKDIRLLVRRNGIELSHTRWKSDVERLMKELDRVMRRKR